MRWERTGRQAPSTLAAGDESPMNHAKVPEVCSLCSPYDARVTEVSCRVVAATHSHRPTIYGPGVPSSATGPRPVCFRGRRPSLVRITAARRSRLTGAKVQVRVRLPFCRNPAAV